MTRLLCTIALLLCPTLASAAPVTFDFAATGVSGWYTFDTATPGVRRLEGSMSYPTAIAAFLVVLGQGDAIVVGSSGDLDLGVGRGALGESLYQASLRLDDFWRLDLTIWSPTDTSFLSTEDLTDTPPNINADDNIHEAVLWDTRRPGQSASTHWLTSLTRRDESSGALRSTPTTVPEPATSLLVGLGLIGASLMARRSRPSSR